MYRKRLGFCLLGGIISAVICLTGRQLLFDFPEVTWNVLAMTIANRIFLGLVIGISAWRMNHLLHGALLGLLSSLTVSIGFLFGEMTSFFLYTGAGILYGILIEWLATDLLRAPIQSG